MERRDIGIGVAVLLAGLLLALFLWLWSRGGDDDPGRVADATDPPAERAGRKANGGGSSSPGAAEALGEEDDEDDDGTPDTREELEARAAELEDDGNVHAICAIDPPLLEGRAHLLIGDPDEIPYDGRLAAVVLGHVYLPLLGSHDDLETPVAGTGWLAVEGYEPVAIEWTAPDENGRSTCYPKPVELEVGGSTITGHVRHAEGEPAGKVFVEGCGNQARTDEDGFYSMAVLPGPCRIQGFRRDGRLTSTTQAVDLVAVEDQDHVIDLALPELPKAGLGIVVEMDDAGVLIREVLEGGAASQADLAAGDRVVEVDGERTTELTLAEFVELATGIEGTEVELIVERQGAERTVVVERAAVR